MGWPARGVTAAAKTGASGRSASDRCGLAKRRRRFACVSSGEASELLNALSDCVPFAISVSCPSVLTWKMKPTAPVCTSGAGGAERAPVTNLTTRANARSTHTAKSARRALAKAQRDARARAYFRDRDHRRWRLSLVSKDVLCLGCHAAAGGADIDVQPTIVETNEG